MTQLSIIMSAPDSALQNSVAAELKQLPLFRQGYATRPEARGLEQLLVDWLQLKLEYSVAEISALGAGLEPGWWLQVSPIAMLTDLTQVYVLGHANLDLSSAEVEELLQPINAYLSQDDLMLTAVSPTEWYLQLPKKTECSLPSLATILNQPLAKILATERSDPYWRGLFTELQMLLNMNPVNTKRRATGLATVDALWIHGNEELTPSLPKLLSSLPIKLISSSSFARGLAKLGQVQWLNMIHPQDWQHLAFSKQYHWVIELNSQLASEDLQRHLEFLEAGLDSGSFVTIDLYGLAGQSYRFKSKPSWRRFWPWNKG